MRALEDGEKLLIEAAQSEPARFLELYERNFDRIYGFFARRVSSREEAQDLTAEVFHQALASIQSFKWQGAPFIAWLYGIAANVLSGHRRRPLATRAPEDFDLSAREPDIERRVLLAQLVESLGPDQRRVVFFFAS